MNHRRKRRRRAPKCNLCTPSRMGNSAKEGTGGTKNKVLREIAKRNAEFKDE